MSTTSSSSTSRSKLADRREHIRHLHKQDDLVPEEQEAYEEFLDDYVEGLQPLEDEIEQWLQSASEEDLSSLESIREGINGLIEDGDYTDDFEQVFREGGERSAQAGRQLADRRYNLGVATDVVPEAALESIDDWVDEAAGSTLETITEDSTSWLRGAHEEGLSIPEIQGQINEDLFEGRLEDHVAERAARTGTISTSNLGVHSSFEESDLVIGEEWIAIGDQRTRDDHDDADGQIVAVDESFLVGGEELDHPGDPSAPLEQIVNCRCTVVAVFADDLTEDEIEALEAGERIQKATVDETVKILDDGSHEPLAAGV
ncbi:capsid protein gpC (plasmid) [Natrialba magadii ATCC 43099]|uniref:Capsid protein gpC n=2 Tax=root TaxID=1 RepID=D3T2F7_NATMM|nr:phage minor head protein [Natrialba magadii]YP_010078039.1 head morphogenesis [Natrialba phage PhiCh1]ADD07766.1 capsid protein gpC [Natrialba magadii ATCC 43099]ELY23013.1 head morphogenesis protein SPP1 gp7 [Natrialba magadii ATCC 43099]QBJ01190.1 head morphogenesis protein [Natrialba phage PhiCh1]